MADDSTIGAMRGIDPSLLSVPGEGKKAPTKELGKDEFLQLLITQLKNQDPMNPMANEEFAVHLAQFSQLEQLIEINNKIEKDQGSTGDLTSLASFLGHRVTLNSDMVKVDNYNGGEIQFQLDGDASEVKVDLLNADGTVVGTKQLGELSAGKHVIALDELSVSSGEYKVQVSAVSQGITSKPEVFKTGIVSGFIPGPEPKLLIDGAEVSPGDIREVNVVPA